jgi:hypothetical protein
MSGAMDINSFMFAIGGCMSMRVTGSHTMQLQLAGRQTDVWTQTLLILMSLSQGFNKRDSSSSLRERDAASDPRCVAKGDADAVTPSKVLVRVTDRPTPTTATVTWIDPTSCRYEDQIWRRSKAKQAGVCALSSEPIRRGDEIYRPLAAAARLTPVNVHCMLLATSVQIAQIDESGTNVAPAT